MTIRFASPNSPAPALRRLKVFRFCLKAANDNAASENSDRTIHAALRHFADHGLAAALEAKLEAEAAARRGDRAEFEKWRDICAALDRRMARKLDHVLKDSA